MQAIGHPDCFEWQPLCLERQKSFSNITFEDEAHDSEPLHLKQHVGLGLTSGSMLEVRTSGFPLPDPENPGKKIRNKL